MKSSRETFLEQQEHDAYKEEEKMQRLRERRIHLERGIVPYMPCQTTSPQGKKEGQSNK